MARNEEKANSMLNRWWAGKNGLLDPVVKRPRFVAKVSSLKECEQWRLDVIKETTKCIATIQNPNLPEERVRALNDEINKLIRERGAWERHIKSLGGADYSRAAHAAMSEVGILGSGGYRYFGAAKNLPGVKELLQERAETLKPGESLKGVDGRDMRDVYVSCDAEYFGYDDLYNPQADSLLLSADQSNSTTSQTTLAAHQAQKNKSASNNNNNNNENNNNNDDDNNNNNETTEENLVTRDANRQRIIALERTAERRLREEAIATWRNAKRKRLLAERRKVDDGGLANLVDDDEDETNVQAISDEMLDKEGDEGDDESTFVPSAEDVRAALLQKRKDALMKQFVSKDFLEQVSN